jgi:predicted ester cyclase
MSIEYVEELSQRYGALWNEQDLDAIMELHHPNCEFQICGNPPVHGIEAVREAFGELFRQSPDLQFHRRCVHVGPDHFVSEWTITGSISETIVVSGLNATPTSQELRFDGTDVIAIKDGKVISKHTYMDGLGLQRQLNDIQAAQPASA